MGVIIPDMKMPNNCGECPLERVLRAEYFETKSFYYRCTLTRENTDEMREESRHYRCPLKESEQE